MGEDPQRYLLAPPDTHPQARSWASPFSDHVLEIPMATCNQAVISTLQLKTVRLSDTKLQAQGHKSGKKRIRFDLAKVCGVTPDARGKLQTQTGTPDTLCTHSHF